MDPLENILENPNEIKLSEYKKNILAVQEENQLLKNKIAITQNVLRRFKLNDVTELVKELVFFI